MAVDAVAVTDLVRTALDMAQQRAELASRNIAQANVAGYSAHRLDFSRVVAGLEQAALAPPGLAAEPPSAAEGVLYSTGTPVSLDAEVAELVAAGSNYQVLADALGRHLGLMRLAVTGRG